MSQKLEFVIDLLGMEAFANKCGLGLRELLSLTTAAEGAAYSIDRISEAISRGAEFKGLASATGETVSQLYRMQEGLHAVGGELSPMMFLQVEKALSGVNEQGLRTDILFSRIGLNINELRSKNPAAAIQEIAAALAKISPDQRAGIAEQIFGRFNAEGILQMVNNMKEFNKGFSSSAQTGALLQKFSDTFEEVKTDWQIIQNDVQGIWVAIAGGIAPKLIETFTKVDGIIHNYGAAFAGAIQGGHVEELLADAMNAAFEQGSFYGERAFAALSIGFADMLAGTLRVVFMDLVPHLFGNLKNEAKLAHESLMVEQDRINIDLISGQAANTKDPEKLRKYFGEINSLREDIAARTQTMTSMGSETQADFNAKMADALITMKDTTVAAMQDVVKAWGTGANAPHDALDRLNRAVAKWSTIALPHMADGSSNSGNGLNLNLQSSNWKQSETGVGLSKMGFIFSGHFASPTESQKIHYMSRTVTLLEEVKSAITAVTLPSGVSPFGHHAL